MYSSYNCVRVELRSNGVAHVELNRPARLNAMNMQLWDEIGDVFGQLAVDANVRAIVLTGAGRAFSVGLDLQDNDVISKIREESDSDQARISFLLGRKIRHMQQCFTNISEPVIVAVHSYCFGGGVDLVTACDIRLASADAKFSIKEVDVGIVADIGTLNRINKVCGNDSWIRDVAYSARTFDAAEALQNQLVSRVLASKEQLMDEAFQLAATIAAKSPIAVQGTKINLNYSRDHTIKDSLEYVSQLFTDDVPKAAMATLAKTGPPDFSKL